MVRTNFKNVLAAVRVIQTHFRGQQEMKHHRQKYLVLREAAITIQTALRGWAQRRRFVVIKLSTLLIQKRFRATIAAQKEKASYKLLRDSCLKIQTAFRGWKARELRKRVLAAITVQKYFRMHHCRAHYRKIREAVIKIQSLIRRKKEEDCYQQLKASVRQIQQRYRAKR